MLNRPSWTKWCKETEGWVADNETAAEKFEDAYVLEGVVRWLSNNSVPPVDCMEQWQSIGMDFDFDASMEVRKLNMADFLAKYRANPPKPDAEMMAEMRSELGEGAVVVDIITGQRTVL